MLLLPKVVILDGKTGLLMNLEWVVSILKLIILGDPQLSSLRRHLVQTSLDLPGSPFYIFDSTLIDLGQVLATALPA